MILSLLIILVVGTNSQDEIPCWMQQCENTTNPGPLVVSVSGVLNKIADLDIDAQTLKMDFFVWFRWENCTVNIDGDPFFPFRTGHLLNLVDRWGLTEIADYEGGNCELVPGYGYHLSRFEGNFQQRFDFSDYPLDHHEIFIIFEEEFSSSDDLVYINDPTEEFSIGKDFRLPGWEILGTIHDTTDTPYQNTYGIPGNYKAVHKYTRVRMGLKIKRPVSVYLVKILPPIMITLGVTLGTFLMEIDLYDTRVATAVGGLAAEIFLQLSFSERLPRGIDYLTLMDHIFNLSYVILLFTIIENIFARHYFRKIVKYQARREKNNVDPEIMKQVQADSGELQLAQLDEFTEKETKTIELEMLLIAKIKRCKTIINRIDKISLGICFLAIFLVLVILSSVYAFRT